MNNLNILSADQTLDEILFYNKSIARYGDGEFDIIFGIDKGFQKAKKRLSNKLKKIIKSKEKNLIIGLDNSFINDYRLNFKDWPKQFWKKWIDQNKYKLINILDTNRVYGSTRISRFYIDYLNTDGVTEYVKKLKKIWDKRNIVIIEGEKSRLGIGNDLFNNSKSIQRILCPSENAFDLYDKIYNEALKIDKNNLILIALGQTATVLAYDLNKAGYQAIDIGHVDIEYEWFLRKAKDKIKIKNKYVNEAYEGNINIDDINDENYINQIISKILN